MNLTFSPKLTKAKQLARQGIEQHLPPKQTERPLPLLLSPSFFCACCACTGTPYSECILYCTRTHSGRNPEKRNIPGSSTPE